MGLHIGSVFIILAASVLGCFLPVVLRNVNSRLVNTVLKCVSSGKLGEAAQDPSRGRARSDGGVRDAGAAAGREEGA